MVVLFTGEMNAQSPVRFVVRSLPANHPAGAAIYLAGSFNGWNPQDENFRCKIDGAGNYFFEAKLEGKHEYKLTRGGWDKVECKYGGEPVENRVLNEGSKAVILDIQEWQDRFPAKPRVSTAGKNVRVIDTAFLIPQLKRIRRVWIYLPEGYNSVNTRYPVLYMHDGQNVFDDATSFGGEWGVDEFMDSTSFKKCIVVAIDNGGQKRMDEYSPFTYTMDRSKAPVNKGEGELYVDFLANTLKPFIDKNYRTLKGRENTFIAGSSMGGLISLYAVLRYPKVYGGAGIFSPALWVSKSDVIEYIRKKGSPVKAKLYFYAGKLESTFMVPDMLLAFEKMSQRSKSKMATVIRDEGRHNEASWRKEFPLFYEWIMR